MKKRFYSCLLIILVILFSFGCQKNHTKEENEIPKKKEKAIGLSVDLGFASRNYETDIIKEEAKKLGYEVYELIAGGNAEAQNSQIERLLEKNISALLVCAVDRNKIESALLQAKAKGVPVIAFDRLIPNSKSVDAYVGPDSVADGMACGETIIRQFRESKEPIQVLELVGALNDQNGIDRSKGFHQVMMQDEKIQVIQVPTDWNSDTAFVAMERIFRSYPDIKAVFCGTDSFFPDVESVLDNIDSSGRWRERIYVTGVNGSKEGYNAVLSGTADGVMVMDLDEIGKAAVTVADKLIKNENVEKNIIIEGWYCTTDTIKESQEYIWGTK